MQLNWEPDHSIRVRLDGETAVVSANRQGLRSLANHLLALAEEPPGSHLHLDRYNALEDDSSGLILEKTE